MLNIFSLTEFLNKKNIFEDLSCIEQYFSTIGQPMDIVEKMMSRKAQNKTPADDAQKQGNGRQENKIVEYVLNAVIVSTVMPVSFVLSAGEILRDIAVSENLPLKIPLRMCIFLLLIMKILFNVLPRSVSVNIYGCALKKSV